MKTGIRSGASHKAQYIGYKAGNKWQKNKIRKLEKRILANVNDKGAKAALKLATVKTYNRKKPGQKGWFHPQEQALIKKIKTAEGDELIVLNTKLATLRSVYADKRPSALRDTKSTANRITVPDQLFKTGLINEKRRDITNSRMASLRKR